MIPSNTVNISSNSAEIPGLQNKLNLDVAKCRETSDEDEWRATGPKTKTAWGHTQFF